jgi:hypothetical protein
LILEGGDFMALAFDHAHLGMGHIKRETGEKRRWRERGGERGSGF